MSEGTMIKQLAILLLTFNFSSSGDILMLVPFGSKSHKAVFTPIANELGALGHNVTLISSFKPSESYHNVNEIIISGNELLYKKLLPAFTHWRDGVSYSLLKLFSDISAQLCENFFQTKLFQTWLENGRRFDSVIVTAVLSECLLSVGYLLSPTVIMINTATLYPWISFPLNIPIPYSIIPNLFLDYTTQMNFWQRMRNAYEQDKIRFMWQYVVYPPMDKTVQRHFKNAKSCFEAVTDVDLVLVNADPVLSSPKIEMPFVKHVGGLHLKPGNNLPQDLAQFVDYAENGVVLFSLGSIFDGFLTTEHVDMFLEAFSKLKYQIIWKYKKNLQNAPKNVKIVQWMPQADILAHKNIRVFMTHCGLLSLQESFYHQVATVAFPLFGDQPFNAAHLTSINATIQLDWDDLSVDKIIEAVNRAAEDETLRKNVERVSKIFKDVPEHPLKKAIYWIEYVMRHKETNHLKPANKYLSFFQYFQIDIVLFLLFIAVLIFFVFNTLLYFIINQFKKLIH